MNTSIKLGLMPSSFSLPFRGRAGVGASGASIARSARPHPDLGAGSQRLPLFGLSSSAQAELELEPQPSAPKGEGATP